MGYSITVNGHRGVADQDEARSFEEAQLAKARDFVAELDDVTNGQFVGGAIGTHTLVDETATEAPAPGTEAEPPLATE